MNGIENEERGDEQRQEGIKGRMQGWSRETMGEMSVLMLPGCGVGREGVSHGRSESHYLTAVWEPLHQENTLVSMATQLLHEPKPVDDQPWAIPAYTHTHTHTHTPHTHTHTRPT